MVIEWYWYREKVTAQEKALRREALERKCNGRFVGRIVVFLHNGWFVTAYR